MCGGIGVVGIEGVDPRALHDYLWEERRILTSRGYYEGEDRSMQWVRVSSNLYTTLPELDYFCDVMEDVAKNGLPEPYKSYKPDFSRMGGGGDMPAETGNTGR